VFLGTACATPRSLIRALESSEEKVFDVKLIHFLTDGAIPMKDGIPMTRFQHKVFFVGSDIREAIKKGKAEYIPISIAQLPRPNTHNLRVCRGSRQTFWLKILKCSR